jgi:hypothetical protein
MDNISKLREANEEFNKMKESYRDKISESFVKVIVEHLALTDNLTQVHWTQYTPYFNDGDTCYFRVNFDLYYIEEWCEDNDIELTDNDRSIINLIEEVVNSVDDEMMMLLFGDHSKVTITKEGDVTIDHYEHD